MVKTNKLKRYFIYKDNRNENEIQKVNKYKPKEKET